MQKAVEDGFQVARLQRRRGRSSIRSNGEVLAFTSLPAYDPNAFAAGIDRATWAALNTDELRPLNDRAIQGRYSPGSTFKMAVATAALEEGVITPDFRVHCGGSATFYGRPFKCWKKGGHGTIDLRHAIEQSCNVYFYTIGNMTGIDKIHKWATLLGLGEKSGIDLPNEVQGLVPSTEWKQRAHPARSGTPARPSRCRSARAQVSVTPVSMAVYAATLANGGTRVTPHLLKAVDDGTGWKPVPPPPPQSQVADRSREAAGDPRRPVDGRERRRHRRPGADRRAATSSGKTGTAQVISNQGAAPRRRTDKDLRDNGWFVFFAPRDNPQIAGVVFLEHGMHGPNAAPVARHVLETFFAKQDGRPLPAAARGLPTRLPGPAGATVAPQPVAGGRRPSTRPCSNAASTTTSTGRCWSRSSRCARSAWR